MLQVVNVGLNTQGKRVHSAQCLHIFPEGGVVWKIRGRVVDITMDIIVTRIACYTHKTIPNLT